MHDGGSIASAHGYLHVVASSCQVLFAINATVIWSWLWQPIAKVLVFAVDQCAPRTIVWGRHAVLTEVTCEDRPIGGGRQVLYGEDASMVELAVTAQALDEFVVDAGFGAANASGRIRMAHLAVRGAMLLETPAVTWLVVGELLVFGRNGGCAHSSWRNCDSLDRANVCLSTLSGGVDWIGRSSNDISCRRTSTDILGGREVRQLRGDKFGSVGLWRFRWREVGIVSCLSHYRINSRLGWPK